MDGSTRSITAVLGVCLAITALMAFTNGDTRMGLLYSVFLLAGIGAYSLWGLSNRGTLWGALATGVPLGLAYLGIAGIVSSLTNVLVYGTAAIDPYMEAMTPSLTSMWSDMALVGPQNIVLAAGFQAFTVGPAEEAFFGAFLPAAIILALAPKIKVGRHAPLRVLLVAGLATIIMFTLYHASAYGTGAGSAGMYAGAAAFRGVMFTTYIMTGNLGTLIVAHSSHNIAVQVLSGVS